LQTITVHPALIAVHSVKAVVDVPSRVKTRKRINTAPVDSASKRQAGKDKQVQEVEPIPTWAAKDQHDIDTETVVVDNLIVGMELRSAQSIHQHMQGLDATQQQAFLLNLFQQAVASEAGITHLDFIVRYTGTHPAEQNWHALTQAEQVDRLAVAARTQTQGNHLYRFDFAEAKAAAGKVQKASASAHTACAVKTAHQTCRQIAAGSVDAVLGSAVQLTSMGVTA
jgi:hypothetical protein